jgi:S1-C subfamily serine protease
MLNYKILAIIIAVMFSFSLSLGISYAQIPAVSNNTLSSNKTLSPSEIINRFLTNDQSNIYNISHSIGGSQGVPLNNTHLNNTQVNTEDNSSQIPITDSVLPKVYKSAIHSLVEITSFDSKNHSISKTGSGFIYDFNGQPIINTASNLVGEKNDIIVTLSDGSTYDSNLTGLDPLTNLAVLSTKNISQNKLIPLPIANSTNLEEGQQVVAIGNTMGLSRQITSGIISGLVQPIPVFDQNISKSSTKIPNGITTSLNLGTGYGGSPLLDTKGQVIGMNIGNYTPTNTIASQTKNTGTSYAVPSNSINKIIPSLLINGYYLHPWFRVSGIDITRDLAKTLNLNESRGLLDIDFANPSPAKKSGILPGASPTNINGRKLTLGEDIIMKIDNKDFLNFHDILAHIESNKNVGDSMLVTVLTNGLIQYNTVKLEANPI